MKKKGFLSAFYPDEWVDSTYSIDFGDWYERGFRGVIFDIDNNQLPRVKPFADAVKSAFVEDAHKPSTKNYLKACEMMGLEKERVLFVGDQLFTDVWGAKRAGIYNILVRPIHPKEEIQIVFKRKLERVVLYFFRKHRPAARSVTVIESYESNGNSGKKSC